MPDPQPVALRGTLVVLNAMREAGVIGEYAICGAVASFRYIEPAVTHDLDVSVRFSGGAPGVVTLAPILRYLQEAGTAAEWSEEGLLIGQWPVQFLPADNDLDLEALSKAEIIDFDGVPTRIWRAEHLMAKCLQVGRAKDQLRLSQFLEGAFDQPLFCAILRAFNLEAQWRAYCVRFGQWNICDPDA